MGILDDLQSSTCSSCHWWQPTADGIDGECHHKSPNSYTTTDSGIKANAIWPITDPTDTCGDHQYRTTNG